MTVSGGRGTPAAGRDPEPSAERSKERGIDRGAAPDPVTLNRSLWSSFVNARSEAALLTGWLAVLVNRVPSASLGVVLEADRKAGVFAPVAVVPDPRRDISGLRDIAERALGSGRAASAPTEDGTATLAAYPVRLGEGDVGAVVVLELRTCEDAMVQDALRDLHWAAGWLSARLWQARAQDALARTRRAGVALDILALAAEHAKPSAAGMAVVNEVQTVMACDQVCIGLIQRRRSAPRIRLLALSYSAWFRRRSSLVEGLETALEECYDQNSAVSWPPIVLPGTTAAPRAIAVAHAEHLRNSRTTHMLTVPLSDEQGPIGALSCERRQDRAFDAEDLAMAESIAALIGPVLDLKARNRRWIGGRLTDGFLHVLGVMLGPRRLSWKLLALALLALGVAAATVRGPFRVQADAVLRGAVQRAAVAPFAGYIEQAPLRAGDRVKAGDLLVRLDDRDLRLETLRWRSEIDRLTSQAREALAQYDRPQVALLESQIAQGRAQLDLADAQLARTGITAPIDGMIVAGDLTQKLGAPVQAGEVLFEVAPLDAFRVDIYVDERDLRYVETGQTGRLTLAGLPTEGIPITTTRLTPIAEVREGANTFRVEAAPVLPPETTPGAALRPGMQGIAKIDAGRALLAWTWSRRLVDWLRETAWTWQP